MSFNLGFLRIIRQSLSPPIPGMIRSKKITSGIKFCRTANAERPSTADNTICPSLSSIVVIIFKNTGWLSTTRIFFFIGFPPGCPSIHLPSVLAPISPRSDQFFPGSPRYQQIGHAKISPEPSSPFVLRFHIYPKTQVLEQLPLKNGFPDGSLIYLRSQARTAIDVNYRRWF